jgi:two-component system chemotaxis response regulator CheY
MAKILVVDDDVTIAEMLREILEEEEHTVTTVHTGQEGVQMFAREPFDLVMQDVNLPGGVSGYGACQTYKSVRDTVAVIMMTGDFKSDQDEALARRLGADGFLRKPFAPRQLVQEVTQGLDMRAKLLGELPVFTCRGCEALFPVQDTVPPEGGLRLACPNCGQMAQVTKKDVVWESIEARTGPQGPEARRILVVEDNARYRQFLAFLLKRAGHVVLEAKSGREGLEFAKRWEPHLVITDVMLPDLDGLAMAGKLREMPKTALLPVVLLTAFQAEAHKQQAKELGATYMAKPIKPDRLLGTIHRLLAG